MEGVQSAEPWQYQANLANISAIVTLEGDGDDKTVVKNEILNSGGGPPPAKKLKLDHTLSSAENNKSAILSDNKENVKVAAGAAGGDVNGVKKEDGDIINIPSVVLTNKNSNNNSCSNNGELQRPKVTPSGEKMNLFNHTAYFNMTLSQNVVNNINGGGSSPVILTGSQMPATPPSSAAPLSNNSMMILGSQPQQMSMVSLKS